MQETGEKDRQTDALETRARSFGHDLKNILGGIIGFTELAMSQAPQDNPRLARFHQKIMESCSRAQGLVDQGLEFSRQKPQGLPQGSPDREEKGPAHAAFQSREEMQGQILVIDDDPHIREILEENIAALGYRPLSAGTLSEGMEILEKVPVELVFLDIRLPDGDGLKHLPQIRQQAAEPEVIIITGEDDAASAGLAIRTGAWDYLQKPLAREKIHLQIERVFDFRGKTTGSRQIVSLKRDEIIGSSHALKERLDQVAQCAQTRANVLISGETGTGKELFARAIHENSPRAGENFVVVDCASLSENLAESLLFGHERGAFTGADRNRPGLLSEAHNGSLFLDEVGELPLSVQKTFLRALQERRFRAVGATREKEIDFRLISATNPDLEAMAAEGKFRADLLFRLRTFEIRLPALRSRGQDIQPLTLHYLFRICKANGMKVKGMLPEFVEHLEAWEWPGNVRELINTLEAAILSDPENPTLFPLHLPDAIRAHFLTRSLRHGPAHAPAAKPQLEPSAGISEERFPVFREGISFKSWRNRLLEKGEKTYLKQLMRAADGNIRVACDMSGLSQSRLYHLLKTHEISK